MENTGSSLKGKRILITGGGGTIGSELCRQAAAQTPERLVLLDICENNAYFTQQALLRKYGQAFPLQVEIASIQDRRQMARIFRTYQPELVFHAAAHKHVPLMEQNPLEAIQNNVFGTQLTASLAKEAGVSRFVFISTDKAVRPASVMGATKRTAELCLDSLGGGNTIFTAVRFGNVYGSDGSVVPLFQQQIGEGGPVTVTHREAARYFMTVGEAVRLVLAAARMAHGGEVFLLDMGEPVRIRDLAQKLIRSAGLIPDKDIPIVYTGLRPGEKLCEEDMLQCPGLAQTKDPRIYTVQQEAVPCFSAGLARLRKAVEQDKAADALHILFQLAGSPIDNIAKS